LELGHRELGTVDPDPPYRRDFDPHSAGRLSLVQDPDIRMRNVQPADTARQIALPTRRDRLPRHVAWHLLRLRSRLAVHHAHATPTATPDSALRARVVEWQTPRPISSTAYSPSCPIDSRFCHCRVECGFYSPETATS
jgi:hypothetical protein